MRRRLVERGAVDLLRRDCCSSWWYGCCLTVVTVSTDQMGYDYQQQEETTNGSHALMSPESARSKLPMPTAGTRTSEHC